MAEANPLLFPGGEASAPQDRPAALGRLAALVCRELRGLPDCREPPEPQVSAGTAGTAGTDRLVPLGLTEQTACRGLLAQALEEEGGAA